METKPYTLPKILYNNINLLKYIILGHKKLT